MAYKFQLGAFTASGSLTAEGNLLAKDSALSGSSLSMFRTTYASFTFLRNRHALYRLFIIVAGCILYGVNKFGGVVRLK